MILSLIVLLAGICALVLAWGLSKGDRLIQYPTLVACAVSFQFVLPLIAMSDPDEVLGYPGTFALERVAVMSILCLLGSLFGYFMSSKRPGKLNWAFDNRRLLQGALVLVAGGVFFAYLLSKLSAEELNATQWSGRTIRYLFFARMGTYGFSMCLLVFAATSDKMAFAGLIPGAIMFLSAIILHGRRTPTAMLGISVVSTMWFCRRKTPPRWLMLAGMAVFVVFVFSIGDYRTIQRGSSGDKVDEVKSIDFADKFTMSTIRKNQCNEVRNAMHIMEAVSRSGKYDYGAKLYNTIIAAYVPRQLVGSEIKNALMAEDVTKVVEEDLFYTMPEGSCTTGVADSFGSFSYLGFLLFVFQGWFMRRIWEGAVAGGIVYQMIYMSQTALQVGAFGGYIGNVFTPWIHFVLFAGPVLLYAKTGKKAWDSQTENDL